MTFDAMVRTELDMKRPLKVFLTTSPNTIHVPEYWDARVEGLVFTTFREEPPGEVFRKKCLLPWSSVLWVEQEES